MKGHRHAVHLFSNVGTAAKVGARRGHLAVLHTDASRMHADGYLFTVSANGGWLVDTVPPQYLTGTG